MSNLTITNRSMVGITVMGAVFANETLTATAAETWPAGAVLARLTATGKLVRFDPALTTGAEKPLAVLTVPVTFAAAGDRSERPSISGSVRREDLVDAAGAAITQAAVDQLRGFTILALSTYQTSSLDNQ
jgi:hypothetical protein